MLWLARLPHIPTPFEFLSSELFTFLSGHKSTIAVPFNKDCASSLSDDWDVELLHWDMLIRNGCMMTFWACFVAGKSTAASVIASVSATVPVYLPWVESEASLAWKESVFDMTTVFLFVISPQQLSSEMVSFVIVQSLGCAVEVQGPQGGIQGHNICLVLSVVGKFDCSSQAPFHAYDGFADKSGSFLFISVLTPGHGSEFDYPGDELFEGDVFVPVIVYEIVDGQRKKTIGYFVLFAFRGV